MENTFGNWDNSDRNGSRLVKMRLAPTEDENDLKGRRLVMRRAWLTVRGLPSIKTELVAWDDFSG